MWSRLGFGRGEAKSPLDVPEIKSGNKRSVQDDVSDGHTKDYGRETTVSAPPMTPPPPGNRPPPPAPPTNTAWSSRIHTHFHSPKDASHSNENSNQDQETTVGDAGEPRLPPPAPVTAVPKFNVFIPVAPVESKQESEEAHPEEGGAYTDPGGSNQSEMNERNIEQEFCVVDPGDANDRETNENQNDPEPLFVDAGVSKQAEMNQTYYEDESSFVEPPISHLIEVKHAEPTHFEDSIVSSTMDGSASIDTEIRNKSVSDKFSASMPVTEDQSMIEHDNQYETTNESRIETEHHMNTDPVMSTTVELEMLNGPVSRTETKEKDVDESSASRVLTVKSKTRFEFYGDTRAPKQLSQIEVQAIRRRREHKARIHEIDRGIASWMAKLCKERMDCSLECRKALESAVHQPMEATADRMLHKMDTAYVSQFLAPNSEKSIVPLEQRLYKLEAASTNHRHVTVFDAVSENLDLIDAIVQHDLRPNLQLESSKADKREGGMVRRFESVAGMTLRRCHEERAARVAALDIVPRSVQKVSDAYNDRIRQYIKGIQVIRAALDREREERQQKDKMIVEKIVRAKEALQRAMLEGLENSL